MKHINKDHSDVKNSTVYTSNEIINFLHSEILPHIKKDRVFDPSVGGGALVNKLKKQGSYIIANDLDDKNVDVDEFFKEDFEFFNHNLKDIDLIIMNPPFNGHPKRKLYPEIFIDKAFEVCGKDTPMIAIIPTGYRMNQRVKSKRWRKVRDNYNITSIVALPLDIFENVLFHTEIVIFNIEGLKPHYFLDI